MNNHTEYQDIINQIKKLNSVKPSREFKSKVDLMLSANIPTHTKPALFASPFRIAVLSLLVFFISGTGIVAASEHSNPGSLLYPVKEVVQDIKIAIEKDPEDRAVLLMQKADDDLREIEQSVENKNNHQLEKNVNSYQDSVNNAYQESQRSNQHGNTNNRVDQSVSRQKEVLEQIENRAPAPAQPALNRAIEASDRSKSEVRGVETINKPEVQHNPGKSEGAKGKQ